MTRRKPLSEERSLSRKRPQFEPRTRFLVLCEGRVTEPEYFEFVRNELRERTIVIKITKNKGDPLEIISVAADMRKDALVRAKRAKDYNLKYDQVWAVLDVDDHHRLPAAIDLAKKEHINLAISNPSFELWALLHHQDQSAHIENDSLRAKLRRHMPEYDKSLDCESLKGKYSLAKNRAEALERQHERNDKSAGCNPSTAVWRLVDEILTAASKGGPSVRISPIDL
ncbi:RloB family protein [Lentzea sp. NPDC054927]